MKVFFDSEFTGLHQNTTLISIGLVDENNRTFYAEFSDYNRSQVDEWIQENVIKRLRYANSGIRHTLWEHETKDQTSVFGDRHSIANLLKEWLGDYPFVEMWSDCLAYDWVFFCDLWGHAFNIPKNIYYIPFDICTMFKLKGVNPDISREEFANMQGSSEKHNALWDAKMIRSCYYALSKLRDVAESS